MDAWLKSAKPGTPGRKSKRGFSSGLLSQECSDSTQSEKVVTEADIYGYKKRKLSDLSHDDQPAATRRKVEEVRRLPTAALNKHIVKTLKEVDNPVTHSAIGAVSDHVSSSATGHQRSEARMNRSLYLSDRSKKLKEQLARPVDSKKVLSGVKIWIDGYLDGTTDIAMKDTVKRAGGDILPTASGATHILTSQQLSGSKTHKMLHGKSRAQAHVVRPEWVTDSIQSGKKLSEYKYRVFPATAVDFFSVKPVAKA